MKHTCSILLMLALLTVGNATADQKIAVTSLDYSKAVPIKRKNPSYPRAALNQNSEGWVIVSVVIDEEGNTKAPVVVDSAGHPAFEKAALKAMKWFKYEPATLDGKPIESCDNRYMFTFDIGGTPGASRSFISKYKRATKLVEQNEHEQALAIIKKLPSEKSFSHYEDSWLNWLTSRYYASLGNSQGEYDALKDGFDSMMSAHVGNSTYIMALTRLSQLSVDMQDYSASVKYFDRLIKKIEDDELTDEFNEINVWAKKSREQINTARYWYSNHSVGERGYFTSSILRPDFSLVGDISKFDDVELRCEAKHMQMDLTEEVTVSIPDSWGQCELFVNGDVGAKLTVVQHYGEAAASASDS